MGVADERSGEHVGERYGQGGFNICEGKRMYGKGQAYRKGWVASLSACVAVVVIVDVNKVDIGVLTKEERRC